MIHTQRRAKAGVFVTLLSKSGYAMERGLNPFQPINIFRKTRCSLGSYPRIQLNYVITEKHARIYADFGYTDPL